MAGYEKRRLQANSKPEATDSDSDSEFGIRVTAKSKKRRIGLLQSCNLGFLSNCVVPSFQLDMCGLLYLLACQPTRILRDLNPPRANTTAGIESVVLGLETRTLDRHQSLGCILPLPVYLNPPQPLPYSFPSLYSKPASKAGSFHCSGPNHPDPATELSQMTACPRSSARLLSLQEKHFGNKNCTVNPPNSRAKALPVLSKPIWMPEADLHNRRGPSSTPQPSRAQGSFRTSSWFSTLRMLKAIQMKYNGFRRYTVGMYSKREKISGQRLAKPWQDQAHPGLTSLPPDSRMCEIYGEDWLEGGECEYVDVPMGHVHRCI
ncbi:hypothetical protein DFH08DRAFT_818949 [Mycena albidolilacea]|uniref:Uncharacterized protein n=1 Tax=Mycena albidolilacea TaxID=1033008 RepID=A0AAD6ZFU0_9AGAR|nr:hypothetical protein DFH08DRAFT_818949 [Mycena albidolilacea]